MAKKTVIFFANFATRGSVHDRMAIMPDSDNIHKEFFKWIQDEREGIEDAKKMGAVVVNCSIIR